MAVKGVQYGLRGVDIVMNSLNRELQQYEEKSIDGMLEFAAYVRADMDTTSPKIPIDTNNLRASWFVTSAIKMESKPNFKGEDKAKLKADHTSLIAQTKSMVQSANKPVVIMGFSANYAWPVHEDMTKNYKRPGSGPKFFEASLNRNDNVLIQILKRRLKL